MTLIDTNVLIDLRECDPLWQAWSFNAVVDARLSGDVAASAISIGELASRRGSLADLLDFCQQSGIRVLPLSVEAAYRAGVAQHDYRGAGGRREKLLADFLIGGEAESAKAALITRDPRPFRRYFPELTLITPEIEHG